MFVSQYNSSVGTLNSVAKTSGLGTIFLNCQSTKVARVSASNVVINTKEMMAGKIYEEFQAFSALTLARLCPLSQRSKVTDF